jgi:hypothetical protein
VRDLLNINFLDVFFFPSTVKLPWYIIISIKIKYLFIFLFWSTNFIDLKILLNNWLKFILFFVYAILFHRNGIYKFFLHLTKIF